ncbi:hypothetical protein [Nostoc sp. ATCC 53789]|uniref:hypothetical protein n=1 Tax=Nostoc sp. ATCC 53789 TaxID=76335 RepID=UPI000DEC9303|nr:hypothetical protein [Nostoc sp. ATCC 53789]QHG17135.1 hypothetical protein GJB62_14905 [Nostoc sp. ATCC 53789]RCJ15525.1 hypothetical protein A6V25_08730 [Nostoc sp. ATCC 53789]
MSINKHRPHILVLPEDDANRQIANGFILNLNLNSRAIQVLPEAGGWKNVLEKFTNDYASIMRQYPDTMVALLIDFDEDKERLSYVKGRIPDDVKNRVFVIGVLSEPERLRRDIKKSFEKIGEALAKDCSDDTNELWGHDLLIHNKTELERMISSVKPFLFNLK